jgi:hypothetical protein
MKLKATPAVIAGKSSVWICRCCGTAVCIPRDGEPVGPCCGCGKATYAKGKGNLFKREHPPISVFTCDGCTVGKPMQEVSDG